MFSPKTRERFIVPALLVALTFLAFSRVLSNDFVDYDDDVYVTANRWVQGGLTPAGVAWGLRTFHAANWHPLTWMSHMLDWSLYQGDAGGHHLTSLLLHVANALLLYFLLRRLTGRSWASATVAALFAVHPLHVESVAWVAERKDVLSTLFLLLTLLAYSHYQARPARWRYALVLAAFALGLTAKPMLVSVPLLLLLLDYWPLGRWRQGAGNANWRRLLVEKLPLFFLALLSCLVTVVAQRAGGALRTMTDYPLGVRLANALVGYVTYLVKMFYPADLSFFYPHPGNTLSAWQVVGAALVLAAITAAVLHESRRRPYLLLGWAWYVVTLLPVIGIVQVGNQAVADRYTYIPLIGPFVICVWGALDWVGSADGGAVPAARTPLTVKGLMRRGGLPVLAGAILVALVANTRLQCAYWRNSHTLYCRALELRPDNWVANHNLAFQFLRSGEWEAAAAAYRRELDALPSSVEAAIGIAMALIQLGQPLAALAQLNQGLVHSPNDFGLLNNRGNLRLRLNDADGAVADFRAAMQADPDKPEPYNNLGNILASRSQLAEAIINFKRAIELDTEYASAHLNLANALCRTGDLKTADSEYQTALQLNPQSVATHVSFAAFCLRQDLLQPASMHAHTALALDPECGPARQILERISARRDAPRDHQ